MNPFGAYALGMSSTADPDVAAQVGASMYNNALQNQQQYDTKMQEMLMKQQDEQLQRQALKRYLIDQAQMTEEQANNASMMPSNVQPAMMGKTLDVVPTYQPDGTVTYSRKTDAPGMGGRPTSAKDRLSYPQQLAAKSNETMATGLQNKAMEAQGIEEKLNEMEPLVDKMPSNRATNFLSDYFDWFNISDATKAKQRFEQLKGQIILPQVKQLGVNPSNRDLIAVEKSFAAAGTDPEANKKAIQMLRNYEARMQEWSDIANTLQNTPEIQENPSLFKQRFNEEINKLPPIDPNEDSESSPTSTGAKPTITNTKPAVGEKKIIRFDATGKRIE